MQRSQLTRGFELANISSTILRSKSVNNLQPTTLDPRPLIEPGRLGQTVLNRLGVDEDDTVEASSFVILGLTHPQELSGSPARIERERHADGSLRTKGWPFHSRP